MKLSIISFTKKGRHLSEVIAEKTEEMETELYIGCKTEAGEEWDSCGRKQPVMFVETSVGEWAGEQMEKRNAILFIGACGIAVRAIAPHLTDKLHDSPVLVIDEGGRFVIPLLSGHVGGANEIAVSLAERLGAEPVITTATDINGRFAVDLFAKRNGLFIVNKDGIARVSARVLAGEVITMSIEEGHGVNIHGLNMEEKGDRPENGESSRENVRKLKIPAEISVVSCPPEKQVDVLIASDIFGEDTDKAALLLRPREYVIGMGCKRGKEADRIESLILRKINEIGISREQIFALASISQKRDEPGIIAWCQREGVPFLTYTAGELREVEGDFRKSSFVKDQVGVDNVCERAAVKACGPGGRLISEKYSEDGMSIAVAKRKWEVNFYET